MALLLIFYTILPFHLFLDKFVTFIEGSNSYCWYMKVAIKFLLGVDILYYMLLFHV